jgi:hypothetical protein
MGFGLWNSSVILLRMSTGRVWIGGAAAAVRVATAMVMQGRGYAIAGERIAPGNALLIDDLSPPPAYR